MLTYEKQYQINYCNESLQKANSLMERINKDKNREKSCILNSFNLVKNFAKCILVLYNEELTNSASNIRNNLLNINHYSKDISEGYYFYDKIYFLKFDFENGKASLDESENDAFNNAIKAYEWYQNYLNKQILILNSLIDTDFNLVHWRSLSNNGSNDVNYIKSLSDENRLNEYKNLSNYLKKSLYDIGDKLICNYALEQFSKIREAKEFYEKHRDCSSFIIDQTICLEFKNDPLLSPLYINVKRLNGFKFDENDENFNKIKVEIIGKKYGFYNNLDKIFYDLIKIKLAN